MVNRLQVKGNIGVYGRSIGGIAATHLLSKFPDQINVFVGDRTMGDFDHMVTSKYAGTGYIGSLVLFIYRCLSCFWYIDNGEGILEASDCYKIFTFDEQDDVVDIFASLHHSVSKKYSRYQYKTGQWHLFYESLKTLFEYEQQLSQFYNGDMYPAIYQMVERAQANQGQLV